MIIIFFRFNLRKKIKINPKKNNDKGILFPENNIPRAKTFIAINIDKNLRYLLFFNLKIKKAIENNAKFFIYPPAINSSAKNPVTYLPTRI